MPPRPDRRPVRRAVLGRIRRVCRESYGDEGLPLLSEDLGIPFEAWEDYEAGEAIPGEVMLRLVCLTGANPCWLLSGEGLPYSIFSRPDPRCGAGTAAGSGIPEGGFRAIPDDEPAREAIGSTLPR